jgi:putative ABC transport system substrate-binding protein
VRRRRRILLALAASWIALSFAAPAQLSPKTWRLGVLVGRGKDDEMVAEIVKALQRRQIADRRIELRLPSAKMVSAYAEAGGLLSYGGSLPYIYDRAAAYVAKIFAGANPGDLPVDQPMRFELVINKRIAGALGLKIPPEVLVQADKVIE